MSDIAVTSDSGVQATVVTGSTIQATVIPATPAAFTVSGALAGAKGDTGATGATGATGQGVVTGGTTGQVLSKIDGTDYNTQWTTPTSVPVTSVAGKTGAVTLVEADVANLTGDLASKYSSTNAPPYPVTTVAGRTGAVVLAEGDITNLTTDLAAKQPTLSLTTTGTSGAATFISNTLNIPQYTGGSGGVTKAQAIAFAVALG